MYTTYEATSIYQGAPTEPLRKGAVKEILEAVDKVVAAYDNPPLSLEKEGKVKRVSREDLKGVLDQITNFPIVKCHPFSGLREDNSLKWFVGRLAYLDALPAELRQGVDYSPIRIVLRKMIKQERKDKWIGALFGLLYLLVLTSPVWILMIFDR